MSDEKEPEKPKKGGIVKKLIFGLVVIILVGGGGAAAGFFVAGSMSGEHEGKAAAADQPKLVAKDGSEVTPPVVRSTEKAVDVGKKQAFDASGYKATYYPVEGAFTSNLKNSDSFVQMSLAIATYYDSRVVENIEAHETAIRSAVLLTLAEQDSDVLSTQQGKEMLQGLLTTAVNRVLNEKAGFGGVDNVYFTSFVVQ